MKISHNDSSQPPGFPPEEKQRKDWNDRFLIVPYIGADGDHRFRVVSKANGKIVASGEGYRNKGDMENLLKGMFPKATIPEIAE